MVYILTVITVKQHLAVHKFLSAELRTCRAAVLHISAALERERERETVTRRAGCYWLLLHHGAGPWRGRERLKLG